MKKPRLAAFAVLGLAMAAPPAGAQERVDLDVLTRIRDEGFRHSEVMALASELMDGVGPRLTGSPNMKKADDWAEKKFTSWGLANAHQEAWGPFGRGWDYEACTVRLVSPDRAELLALPEAWTPGTNGAVRANAMRVKADAKEDLEKYKGKLAGKIVFFGDLPEIKTHDKGESARYDDKELAELFEYEIPGRPGRYDREAYRKRRELYRAAGKFFAQEKALAIVTPSRRENSLAVQGAGD